MNRCSSSSAGKVGTCFVLTAAVQGSSPFCSPLLSVAPPLLSRLSVISKLSRHRKAIKQPKRRESSSLARAPHLQLTLHD